MWKKKGIELIGYAAGFEVPQRLFCFINVNFGERGHGGKRERERRRWWPDG